MRVNQVSGIICNMGLMLLLAIPVTSRAADERYRLFRPGGPGPHPAVVFVSGCSGFTPAAAPNAYVHTAEHLRGLGFVVLWADYLRRRNLQSCTEGVSQFEAAQDAIDAAAWLKSQPYVDAKRVAAVGWSYGGGAVLSILATRGANALTFSRVAAFYPYCAAVAPWSNRTPVLILLAGSDDVAPHSLCKSALDGSSARADIKLINFEGAYHAFDQLGRPPKMKTAFGTLGYQPQAAAAALKELDRFLQTKQ